MYGIVITLSTVILRVARPPRRGAMTVAMTVDMGIERTDGARGTFSGLGGGRVAVRRLRGAGAIVCTIPLPAPYLHPTLPI